jgi:hypothetical protein
LLPNRFQTWNRCLQPTLLTQVLQGDILMILKLELSNLK